MIHRTLKQCVATIPAQPTQAAAAAGAAVLDLKSAGKRRRTQLLKPVARPGAALQPSPPPSALTGAKPVFSEAAKRRSKLSLSPVKVVLRSAARNQPSRTITLPAQLARPLSREVEQSVVDAIAPELKNTPVQYVRDSLAPLGTRMLGVLASTSTEAVSATTSSELPSSIAVTTSLPVSESSILLPTHMLAVHSSLSTPGAGPSTPRKVTLFPAHSLVLASNCSNLPALPIKTFPVEYSDEETVKGMGRDVRTQLPLVPLALPSPETFASLSTYLYTRRADQLLASLVPIPPPTPSTSSTSSSSSKAKATPTQPTSDSRDAAFEAYATHLRASASRNSVLAYAMRVHGIWRNACALGVNDAQLWGVIERAWTVLIRALDSPSEELSASSPLL